MNDEYYEALKTSKRLGGAEGIDAVIGEFNLDGIVMPSEAGALENSFRPIWEMTVLCDRIVHQTGGYGWISSNNW